jgi:hypothetical protein
MARELSLDGAEISIIKTLGIGGSEMQGETLLEKMPELHVAELASVLKGLVAMGYINADSSSFHSEDEFKKTHFQVNPGYSKDIREALDPQPTKPKSRRVRRE